jgi:hypothetical protein
MASTQDIYTELKKELHTSGSKAQVILPSDGDVYEQSIKRWSDHCVKRAVNSPSPPFLPNQYTQKLNPHTGLRRQAHHPLRHHRRPLARPHPRHSLRRQRRRALDIRQCIYH